MSESSRWADGPFPLIATPNKDTDGQDSHVAVHCASEMSLAHNVLIRGVNAIYRQGAFIKEHQDISDFLFFCSAWVKTTEHHHHAEETVLFPELEAFTKKPEIMGENKAQHEAFLAGLENFGSYAHDTKPENYKWSDAKEKLDVFAPDLIKHLREEIDTLLVLKAYDSDQLQKVWKKTEDAAKGDVRLPHMFDTILPMVLGCADKTYEGGIHKFPPFPFFFPYLVNFWFAKKYKGAWRFCPCDMYGQPRPLAFAQ